MNNIPECGDTVTARMEITDEATGDHPMFLLARKGDELEVTEKWSIGHDLIVVNHSLSENPFGVDITEVIDE